MQPAFRVQPSAEQYVTYDLLKHDDRTQLYHSQYEKPCAHHSLKPRDRLQIWACVAGAHITVTVCCPSCSDLLLKMGALQLTLEIAHYDCLSGVK